MKVFLSHSSANKGFVRDVSDTLGHDVAVLDEYVLEAGRDLWQEIRAAILECDLFVYFISHEALESDWVKNEISFVRELEDDGRCKVLPFIVDDTPVEHDGIRPWIRNKLLQDVKSPRFVARNIRRALAIRMKEKNQSPVVLGDFFEGRDDDMRKVREGLNRDRNAELRAISIAGLAYCGRKRFLREIINQHIRRPGQLDYQPIYISLGENESLVEIVGILNDEARCYSKEEILEAFGSKERLLAAAVNLFNATSRINERVVIDDGGTIVLRNGKLVDWFRDLMHAPNLSPQVHFFIAARNDVAPDVKQHEKRLLLAHHIDLLSLDAMRSLLNAYVKETGKKIDKEEQEEFLKTAKGYPDILLNIMEVLWRDGLVAAKKYAAGDAFNRHSKEVNRLISEIRENEMHFSLLVFLSRFDFLSFSNLVSIFGEDQQEVMDALERFRRMGIMETFGKGGEYLRLATPVHDNITRRKDFQLSDKYNRRLRRGLRQYVDALVVSDDMPSDFSEILAGAKETLKTSKAGSIAKKLLIPAFVVKVVMEQYNAGNYEDAYELAHRVLYDYSLNNYDSMMAPIRYWMCLAMCRLHKDEVLEEAALLNNDYKRFFVRGFYYSCLKRPDYIKAEREYRKALKNSGLASPTDNIKAKHQLVIALQKRGLYEDALDFSRDCYYSDTRNPYYIHAYFESLVKSGKVDPLVLKELVDSMGEVNDASSPYLQGAMQAQISYYSYMDYSTAKQQLLGLLDTCPSGKTHNSLLRLFKELAGKNNDLAAYNTAAKRFNS